MLSIRVLGTPQIERDGVWRAVGGPQRTALLGCLVACHGHVVSFSDLVDELWGSRPPLDAPNAVRSHVSRLRTLLRQPGTPIPIAHCAGGYRLDVATESVDASVFECLVRDCLDALERRDFRTAVALGERAIALWTGPTFVEADEYGLRRRAAVRLEEQRLTVVVGLSKAYFQLGAHQQAVPRLRAELLSRPGWEEGCALLMTALVCCGRRAEALDAYHRTRTWLRRHHGIDPGPELQRLSLTVLRADQTPTEARA